MCAKAHPYIDPVGIVKGERCPNCRGMAWKKRAEEAKVELEKARRALKDCEAWISDEGFPDCSAASNARAVLATEVKP